MKSVNSDGFEAPCCINVEKVYDWIVQSVEIPLQSFIGNDGICILQFTCGDLRSEVGSGSLTAACYLTDAEGNQLDPLVPGAIQCHAFPQVKDFEVQLPSGKIVTLQKVKILIQGYFVVQLSNEKGESCISAPQPFTVEEKFLLCMPAGTTLECKTIDFECDAAIICETDSSGNQYFQQIAVSIELCESVQAVGSVTLDINACEAVPRDLIIPSCSLPIVPH